MVAKDSDRLRRALEAIDAANQSDPQRLEVRGVLRPKEQAHAELASEWIERLVDTPSEALRLASRAHHLCRWEIPRSAYPTGRSGYHRWRKALQALHAERASAILEACGYDASTIQRVRSLICKQGLGRDAEAQALEDALCLVFLETQLTTTAAKLGDETKALDVLRKTLRKMSPQAVRLAAELQLDGSSLALLRRAQDTDERGGGG